MLTAAEEKFVRRRGYLPEHVTGYVRAVSGGEPALAGDYLYYLAGRTLIFVGYPLAGQFRGAEMRGCLLTAERRVRPATVSLMAPDLSALGRRAEAAAPDRYYRLELSGLQLSQRVRNTLRRASEALTVVKGRELGAAQRELLARFLNSHPLSRESRFVYEKIPEYLSSVGTARVYSAVDSRGNPAAVTVAEFGTREYAHYLFNFRDEERPAPGASDLLLNGLLRDALEAGKSFLNLGLGISDGVRFFKEKWGGTPFLEYRSCRYRPGAWEEVRSYLEKL